MEHSGFNYVDLAVFITILLSGLLALFRGLVRELLSLASWVGAAIATVYFYPLLRPWMHQHIKSEFTADAATALTLFCGSLIVFIPIGYALGSLVRGKALTAIDRSLGFVFGLVRGVLVVCLLFLLTLWIWPEQKKEPEVLATARTRPLMAASADVLKGFFPKEDFEKISDEAKRLEDKASNVPLDQAPSFMSKTQTGESTVGPDTGKTPTVDSVRSNYPKEQTGKP